MDLVPRETQEMEIENQLKNVFTHVVSQVVSIYHDRFRHRGQTINQLQGHVRKERERTKRVKAGMSGAVHAIWERKMEAERERDYWKGKYEELEKAVSAERLARAQSEFLKAIDEHTENGAAPQECLSS